ncbi:barstar family protein [uncultured Oxalicibacterium sp.]|uniref:barstar family protein n=1 Tax=uncultured Oxalicibacterium sp. TaxID=1168540 RepID=UPI0025CD4C27|nr:barstar family protein [uncultured Oxalicibacterium sp.]
MATAQLDGALIAGWEDFHTACKTAFGFPDFYGANMDAWVDCMSYLRDDDGMTRFRLKDNEVLQIVITHADVIKTRFPELLEELAFCIDAINDRYADYGEKAALALKLA